MQSVVRSWVLAAFAAFSACVPIAADASSLALSTPSGLNVGDTFRFIFVTAGTTAATSTDISRYDEFVRNDVSTQYGTVTYGGSAITEWLAVGSTANINANVHIGTGTGASYRGIYLPGGSRVAASEAALWSVTLDHAIDQTLNGGAVAPTSVWTGTAADGASGLYPLGGTSILDSVSIFGQAGKSIFLWVSTSAVSNRLWIK